MKRRLFLMLWLTTIALCNAAAQTISIDKAKFSKGDNSEWKNAIFDDSAWRTIKTSAEWDYQGEDNPNAYAWYRMTFTLPADMFEGTDVGKSLVVRIGKVDDADQTYLNGTLIGSTGRMADDPEGYLSEWDTERVYYVDVNSGVVNKGGDNVLAVRVYNGNSPGGLVGGVTVSVPSRIDGLAVNFTETESEGQGLCAVTILNNVDDKQNISVKLETTDTDTGLVTNSSSGKASLKKGGSKTLTVGYDRNKIMTVTATITDNKSGRVRTHTYIPKYILTPPAPAAPRYNGPTVYGVRPSSPVIFRLPFSGVRPMTFSVSNMPEGLAFDAEKGVLSGSIDKQGEYTLTFTAENTEGSAEQQLTIKVGDKIALTPPMGWNSWNCWGLSVSQEKVISSAQAIIDKGLADYGYSYINVDDAWEAAERAADGTLPTNDKFPDMKGLGDWLHSNGLKFGIYSSPGDYTCGKYLGSIGHEKQDAEMYNSWGIDYLKYDWCGYGKEFAKSKDKTVAAYIQPYMLMEKYLREQPRDIFYSLCQYGMANVWEWGKYVDANSWRTTGDITDTWESLYSIGFVSQADLWPYAEPGRWNDPDMLIVGKVGWSANLRNTRLTPDEQYSHITLWTLLASNMLIGCDIAQIDDFTLSLLCNNEVNAINQDVLGMQARQEVVDGDIQIWKRPLSDGSYAVGIFNLGKENATVDFNDYLKQLGITELTYVRDLWRQQDLDTSNTKYFIPAHGTKYIKIRY